ncbi:unnamed protein product [Penicillium olsonii]|nr:unnamed protein product [Penicillium olsonii]CAG7928388.1 unnamed protein product [Penicillium olsonii]
MPQESLFLNVNDQCGSPQPPWDYRLDGDWETILTGDNFDLDAVNTSLLHATSEALSALDIPDIPELGNPDSSVDEHAKEQASLLQRKWHTFFEVAAISGHTTPEISQSGGHIDDSYRHSLHERLQPRVQHGILPSTRFLNLCLQFYFSKFHPLFPVVHVPTFRPETQNSILLLSICSVGSLIIGSSRALSHGISMFERLNKAILASWESYLSKPGCTCTIALQASLIGQTFGLLMGWARKSKLFLLKHSDRNIVHLEGDSLNDAWMAWIQDEVNMRP